MRVLLVVHDFLPNHVAGVEVYTDEIAAGLAGKHDVALLYSEMAPGESDLQIRRGQHKGCDTFELVNNHRFTRFEQTFRHRGIDARLVEVLDEFRPDVVHIQHLLNLSIGLVDELFRRGVPIVMTLHDHWLACANGGQRFHHKLGRCEVLDASRCGACTAHMNGIGLFVRGVGQRRTATRPADKNPLAKRGESALRGLRGVIRRATSGSESRQTARIERRWEAMRDLVAKVDLFIAPSQYLAGEFLRFGVPAEKMLCTDYGFSAQRFPRRPPLPERARRFGFVGTLAPHKGAHILIEAFNGMPADAELHLCGSPDDDPGYAAELRRGVQHPGVVFVGGIAPERVSDFLQEVDCLVAPSIWHENSPLCIHEAFLSGIPVIASRVGGQADLLAKGGGWVYEPDAPGELRALLLRLFSEAGMLRELAAKAPQVKSFDDHMREIESIYRSLCSGAGK